MGRGHQAEGKKNGSRSGGWAGLIIRAREKEVHGPDRKEEKQEHETLRTHEPLQCMHEQCAQVAGSRRRRIGSEGTKQKGNDEPNAMVRSDFVKTHRASEQRDERDSALRLDIAPTIFGRSGWNQDVEDDDTKPTPQTVRPADVG